MVFIMVVLGGVTRLTESGLSITEWKPFRGSLPPITLADWEEEFVKYKSSPEYEKLNKGMTVQDFQKIFWMEWIHREWGRLIGFSFALPMSYFLARKYITGTKESAKFLGLLFFGGMQGAVGWVMVKSGLDPKNFEENNSVPRVSQYRLAAHLGLAVSLYSTLLWMGLRRCWAEKWSLPETFPRVTNLKFLRQWMIFNSGLIGLTAFSGAFVAGLDAGLGYPTYPKMNGQWIPDGLWVKSPLWRNFFENETAVQFNHRILGITTFSSVASFYYYLFHSSSYNKLPRSIRLGSHALMGTAALQVILGITTVLHYVPIPLAASHQAGAMTLLTSSIYLLRLLQRIPK
jgi:cytochrome c oxidase assembly protein subunit 15